MRTLIFLCVFSLFPATIVVADEDTGQGTAQDPEAFAVALQTALDTPGSPYQLQVNCTDEKGIRSFNLFPGGVAVWNGRSQLVVPVATRSELLKSLLDRDFPSFEARYGGGDRPDKKAAPARVTCRIWAKIGEMRKSSAQLAGGEQSAMMTGLAAELIDLVEPFAEKGVTPENLPDALGKLADGQLAPECLGLRFVDLPARDYTSPGTITRIRGGRISLQAYAPGRNVAEQNRKPLGNDEFMELIAALVAAEPSSLPGNLWSEDQLEFELQVLGHKKVVLARPFTRLAGKESSPAQQRFDALLLVLRELSR